MEKKNLFDEKPIHNNDISKYFNNDLPITFDKIQNEFNIRILGCNFEVLNSDKKMQETNNIENIAGMISIEEDITLYYNENNSKYDKKEQRFIVANLIAYCMNFENSKKKQVVKDYDFMVKCDESFDDMSTEELEECINNKIARQILMPEKQFKLRYAMLISSCSDDDEVMRGLSYIFQVPHREVVIRGKELGISFDIPEAEKVNVNSLGPIPSFRNCHRK